MTTNSISFSLGGPKRGAAGKTAFGIKAPPRIAPVSAAFGADESDEEEQDQAVAGPQSAKRQRLDVPVPSGAPAPPADPDVRKVVEKLAEFVAKNGRNFEEVTRQRNPEDSPFRFLYHRESADYKYYEHKLTQAEAQKTGSAVFPPTVLAAPPPMPAPAPPPSNPATAQPVAPEPAPRPNRFREVPAAGSSRRDSASGSSAAPGGADTAAAAAAEAQRAQQAERDSVAAMEAYAQAAAAKERARAEGEERERARVDLLNVTSFDRRRQVAVYKADGKRGHHMQDFIPPEELAKVLAKSGSETAKAQAAALEEQQRIQADNVGHRMLQKMGWREGQGLGANASGIAAPISAASGPKQATDKGGLGVVGHGEVEEGDDEFEVYRKRMMLGYKHRPNPLGNPRKSYY